MGGLDEGQIPAVHSAGAEPEHGATHPGHSPKVKSYRREPQYILLSPAVYCLWDSPSHLKTFKSGVGMKLSSF